MEWIGVRIEYPEFGVGISAARAAWLVKTLENMCTDGAILVGRLNEIAGRMSFAFSGDQILGPISGAILCMDRFELSERISPLAKGFDFDLAASGNALKEELLG